MIEEQKCYGAVCDKCGEHYEEVETEHGIYLDKHSLVGCAEEDGWQFDGDKCICRNCSGR
ncbi:MAG: hypothetical protein ACRCZY_07880 [Phocaeicola sp.]